MTDYIVTLNEIRDAVKERIGDAEIKNLNGVEATIYKRNIPRKLGPESVPLISVFKREARGAVTEADQPDIRLPATLAVGVGIADYSSIDIDEAEVLTDDLINKIIDALTEDLSLGDTVYGITVSSIVWDDNEDNGIWFSLPTIDLELTSVKIE
jgi:hypothetical protein